MNGTRRGFEYGAVACGNGSDERGEQQLYGVVPGGQDEYDAVWFGPGVAGGTEEKQGCFAAFCGGPFVQVLECMANF